MSLPDMSWFSASIHSILGIPPVSTSPTAQQYKQLAQAVLDKAAAQASITPKKTKSSTTPSALNAKLALLNANNNSAPLSNALTLANAYASGLTSAQLVQPGQLNQQLNQANTAYYKHLTSQQQQQQIFQQGLAGLGSTAFSSGQWGTAPSEGDFPARKVIWTHGHYSVGREGGAYYLSRLGSDKYGNRIRLDLGHWELKAPPSRELIASIIRWDRAHKPHVNAIDAYGSLLGVRFFNLTDDMHLKSPHQATIWKTEVLCAPMWSDTSAVRGECGIHAAWPALGRDVRPIIDSDGYVIARVRGQGRVVKGREGWRAEQVIIDTVYLPLTLLPKPRRELERRYPAISFEDETWTLEKSSKSLK